MDQASIVEYLKRRDQDLVGPQQQPSLPDYLLGRLPTLWSPGPADLDAELYGYPGRFARDTQQRGTNYAPGERMAPLERDMRPVDRATRMLTPPGQEQRYHRGGFRPMQPIEPRPGWAPNPILPGEPQ